MVQAQQHFGFTGTPKNCSQMKKNRCVWIPERFNRCGELRRCGCLLLRFLSITTTADI